MRKLLEEVALSHASGQANPTSTSPDSTPDHPQTAGRGSRGWRRQLHWLLLLALVPLALTLVVPVKEKPIPERITETLEPLPPAERDRVIQQLQQCQSEDESFAVLPNRRLKGALLAHDSYAHWYIAGAAVVLFLAFFMFLAGRAAVGPAGVLGVGLFTSTVGIGLLLIVPWLFARAPILIANRIGRIIYIVLAFIVLAHHFALDPKTDFAVSLVAFTLGVALSEELVKTIPLYWHDVLERGTEWRGLFTWGLASGAGFGIAEGILYAGQYYNGISGSDMYLVRFISCVALHAIWSGSAAILIYKCRIDVLREGSWWEMLYPKVYVVAVPVVLHGLYDALLKYEWNFAAVAVALASFGYLAYILRDIELWWDGGIQLAVNADKARQARVSSAKESGAA
jgi:RsiW-degrading membrane proteinase PrsW (M82 family)